MLDFAGSGRTQKCTYCRTVVQVPQALWQPAEQARSVDQWKKWIIIFLIVTVGLPTCLGTVGSILGIGAGLLGAVVSFAAALFGH
jgi:hypothetical protein